jgi:hypothetical protein
VSCCVLNVGVLQIAYSVSVCHLVLWHCLAPWSISNGLLMTNHCAEFQLTCYFSCLRPLQYCHIVFGLAVITLHAALNGVRQRWLQDHSTHGEALRGVVGCNSFRALGVAWHGSGPPPSTCVSQHIAAAPDDTFQKASERLSLRRCTSPVTLLEVAALSGRQQTPCTHFSPSAQHG